MKRNLLNENVGEELDHIDRGDRGSDQNGLRMMYNIIRRRDLGRDPATPRAQSVRSAVQAIRENTPAFVPRHDESYFRP